MTDITPAPFPAMRGGIQKLRPGVVQVRIFMVNVYLLGERGQDWVLVDAGLPGSAQLILAAAQQVHGARAPSAIVLTHGHTDHVGALNELLKVWGDVPVYAHPRELPYLTGQAAYTVFAKIKLSLPTNDFSPHIQPLVADEDDTGAVPFLPDWRWIATPGHVPGQVSLWREADHTLVAGDALGTVELTSPLSMVTGKPSKVAHAALYASRRDAQVSVGKLADLAPTLVAAGHGMSLKGAGLGAALRRHQESFDAPPKAKRKAKGDKPKGLPRPVKVGVALLGLGTLLGWAMLQNRE